MPRAHLAISHSPVINLEGGRGREREKEGEREKGERERGKERERDREGGREAATSAGTNGFHSPR